MTEDALVGAHLGPCRIDSLVAVGGMGRVYKGLHEALERVVAIKLVDRPAAEGSAPLQAVLAEARAAAKLEDPRIVAVYDVGEDRGYGYIVMQWVDGESLEQRVRRAGPLPVEEALSAARDVAGALAVAHAAGVIHRDVKPGNVLLGTRGPAKLGDFGLASSAGSVDGGTSAGSFHFMAPEQGWGAPPDARMDLYGLGATLYYALTGLPLYPGAPADAMISHREKPPPDVREARPEVTSRAAELIRSLLEKDPALRPQSAAEVARLLETRDLLLDTEGTGSPFRLLPSGNPTPKPRRVAVEAPIERPAPPPPPPPAAPALGSRRTFFFFLAALGIAAVAWPWRGAGVEDWFAACLVGSAAPLLLTIGDRRSAPRVVIGSVIWVGTLASAARYAALRGGSFPSLETLILAGFGVVVSGGASYLALWGTDRDEILWARILSPFACVLLSSAALSGAAPVAGDFWRNVGVQAARSCGILSATGGFWRWGGLVAFACVIVVTRRMRLVFESGPKTGRGRNWAR
jgi:serine/threonine-protein kinase